MNWQTIKNSSDLVLDGIAFDVEWRDGSLAAVTATDKSGHAVRLVLESYSVKAMVPAKPKIKTVHVVTAKVRMVGTEIRETFDEKFDATNRKAELEHSDVCEDIAVKTEDVEVPF